MAKNTALRSSPSRFEFRAKYETLTPACAERSRDQGAVAGWRCFASSLQGSGRSARSVIT